MSKKSDPLALWPELAAIRDRLLVVDESARAFGRRNLDILILTLRPYMPLPPGRLLVTDAAAALVGLYPEDFPLWATENGISPARMSGRGTCYWRAGDLYRAIGR
jgi:hypothetical protein